MATITTDDLNRLANLIIDNIRNEFALKHLSNNLVNTITVSQNPDGSVSINIPAQIYDIFTYKSKGQIIYNGKGSYASQLNGKGSSAGNHKGYIDKAISESIDKWSSSLTGRFIMTKS